MYALSGIDPAEPAFLPDFLVWAKLERLRARKHTRTVKSRFCIISSQKEVAIVA
jgi:hypothetical protein